MCPYHNAVGVKREALHAEQRVVRLDLQTQSSQESNRYNKLINFKNKIQTY